MGSWNSEKQQPSGGNASSQVRGQSLDDALSRVTLLQHLNMFLHPKEVLLVPNVTVQFFIEFSLQASLLLEGSGCSQS